MVTSLFLGASPGLAFQPDDPSINEETSASLLSAHESISQQFVDSEKLERTEGGYLFEGTASILKMPSD